MSQNKKEKKTKKQKNKKMDATTKIIIGGLCIIAIPFLVLGYIIISASMNTGKTILGDRFNNDLNPAITTADITEVKAVVGGMTDVENVDVILKTATLRVYVDVVDSKNAEEVKAIAEEVYQKVISVLDEQAYFTQHDNMKMYDMEVHVYNLEENRDSDLFSYAIASKSSIMETYLVQIVSEPRDPELAQRLLEELEAKRNPTPTPDDGDMTVGGEETEGSEIDPDTTVIPDENN